MPATATTVSTLADVLRLFERVMSAMGDGTPVMIGKQYLKETGPGSAPRVVFIPDEQGKLGPPLKLGAGYIAGWTHGCRVCVRAAEPGDDPGRNEAAYQLAARVVQILKGLDPAHIVLAPGNPTDDSPLQVDGPGADITFAFTYSTNIAQDPAVLRAIAAAITSVSPPNPDQPGGSTGLTFDVGITAEAVRP